VGEESFHAESSNALRTTSRKTTNIVDNAFHLSQRKLNRGFRGDVGEAEFESVIDWISVRGREGLRVREVDRISDIQDLVIKKSRLRLSRWCRVNKVILELKLVEPITRAPVPRQNCLGYEENYCHV
jgi:hypothetical protein